MAIAKFAKLICVFLARMAHVSLVGSQETAQYDSNGLQKGVFTELWVKMNDSEALSYYLPEEIHRFSRKMCDPAGTKFHGLDCFAGGLGAVPMTTGICANTEGFFLRPRSITPDSKTLLDVMWWLLKRGTNALVVVGDSVTRQFYSECICSAVRFGFDTIDLGADPRGTGIMVSESMATNNVAYRKFAQQFPTGIIPANPKVPFFKVYEVNYGGTEKANQHIALILNIAKETGVGPADGAPLLFVSNIGLHYHTEEELEHEMKILISEVFKPLILNGHQILFRETSAQHFLSVDGLYEQKLASTFEQIENWRSPIAIKGGQFFAGLYNAGTSEATNTSISSRMHTLNSTGIDYSGILPNLESIISPEQFPNLSYRCVPITSAEALNSQNWRNRLSQRVIDEFNAYLEQLRTENSTPQQPQQLQQVQIHDIKTIPWWKITASRYDLHLGRGNDCTHFCHGPMLHATVFNFIAEELISTATATVAASR